MQKTMCLVIVLQVETSSRFITHIPGKPDQTIDLRWQKLDNCLVWVLTGFVYYQWLHVLSSSNLSRYDIKSADQF